MADTPTQVQDFFSTEVYDSAKKLHQYAFIHGWPSEDDRRKCVVDVINKAIDRGLLSFKDDVHRLALLFQLLKFGYDKKTERKVRDVYDFVGDFKVYNRKKFRRKYINGLRDLLNELEMNQFPGLQDDYAFTKKSAWDIRWIYEVTEDLKTRLWQTDSSAMSFWERLYPKDNYFEALAGVVLQVNDLVGKDAMLNAVTQEAKERYKEDVMAAVKKRAREEKETETNRPSKKRR